MSERYSLQRDLNRWIIVTTFVFVLVAGLVASGLVFHEAREIQDSMLRQIAYHVDAGQLTNKTMVASDLEEESIIIQKMDIDSNAIGLKIPAHLTDGMQTVAVNGEKWRVFVTRLKNSNQRYAVAQQTELRNEVALASSMNVLIPIIIMVTIMLFIIHYIIRSHLKPLKSLASQLDQQDLMLLQTLSNNKVPEEILPFVSSINALLLRIQEAMQKQYRFIADAAHELRTPVTALSLLADNIQTAHNETEREERQKLLQSGLDRLRVLVRQLLDLARLQSHYESDNNQVSLQAVIPPILAELYPLAEKKQIDLGMLNLQDAIVVDQDGRLSQLIRNAIDNAIRYTPAGGKVDVSVVLDKERVVIAVEDSGSGIPEDELEQVKQPFYRSKGNKQEGNGLGLAISYEIAHRLGGRITLANRPQGGLSFKYSQNMSGRS